MYHFTPFSRSLSNLEAADLATLKCVTEGWYIEYKQEVPKSESIAKSIAAMANSYGGWIFYGIKEESKENSVAGEFIGINIELADAALQKIRQAVASAVNPDCHFEAKAIVGPCDEIGLGEDKCIICIAVPQSIEAPHIHSKGVIYRRIADGSEPVPETDRHMIEKMFQRSKDTIDSFQRWLDRDPELSKGESNTPYLRLMITPNIWQLPRTDFSLNVETIKTALNKTNGRTSAIPFDTFYTSANGIIARQCAKGDPTIARLTWHFHRDLSSDILIPLTWFKGNTSHILYNLKQYNHIKEFTHLLESSEITDATVINLSLLYNLLMGVIESQREILQQANWPQSFHIKAKLLNVWRTVPFIDADFFIKYISDNGIPVCLTSECISPPGAHPDSFYFIGNEEKLSSDLHRVTLQTIFSLIPIAEALGIPIQYLLQKEPENRNNSDFVPILTQLSDTGVRAAKIQ